jgi:hypothetical protein
MEVLGYSGISVTMNTYAHVLPALRQEAADAIDGLFEGIRTATLARGRTQDDTWSLMQNSLTSPTLDALTWGSQDR